MIRSKILILCFLALVAGCGQQNHNLGGWHKDPNTGCKVWWPADSEDSGALTWSGECQNGKANGKGTVYWEADDLGAPRQNEVRFSGHLENGKLTGTGEWLQTQVYSNVIHTIVKTGTWKNSQLEGDGTFRNDEKFLADDGPKVKSSTYEGQFRKGVFSGLGRRETLKEYHDGQSERRIEVGDFSENKLNGLGRMRIEAKRPNEWHKITISEGNHWDGQFRGPGKQSYEYRTDSDKYSSMSEYEDDISEGGIGMIIYSGGDKFEGKVDALGGPVRGICNFQSVSFEGACVTTHKQTSDTSGQSCLSPTSSKNECLKVIAAWVS